MVADFVHNYSSFKFEFFFGYFGGSLLSRLNHLCVCDLCLKGRSSTFITIINSFASFLKHLDLVRVDYLGEAFEFNLPNLQSIRLKHCEINGLTLNAPKLVELKIWYIGESALVLIKDFLSFQLKV